MSRIAAELERICGAGAVKGPQARADEQAAAKGCSSEAPTVHPADLEQLQQVVRLAGEQRWRIQARGGDTRRYPWERTSPADLFLCVDRLGGVGHHRPEDLTLCAGAGATLADLEAHLAPHGQRLPLDPFAEPGATLAGTLACDAFGPRRFRLGTARDWVIGTRLVRPDGEAVRSGGMEFRNVTGHDLTRLYIGSYGSLGVLVEADLKLSPAPQANAVLHVPVNDRAEAELAVQAVYEQALPLAYGLYRQGGGPASRGDDPRLWLHFEGVAEALAEQVDHGARTLAGELSLEPHRDAEGFAPVIHEVRELLTGGPAAGSRSGCGTRLRLHTPPAAHAELLRDLDLPAELCIVGLPGSGISWILSSDDRLVGELERIRLGARSHGGFIAVEQWPEGAPDVVWIEVPPPARGMMQKLKAALDPAGMFCCGPFDFLEAS